MAKRRMPTALAAYWAKKRVEAGRRKQPHMAQGRYKAKAKAAYGKYRGQSRSEFRVTSLAAGAAARVGGRAMPGWGAPLATIGVGMATKNQFATDIGMFQAGGMLADSLSSGTLFSGLLGGGQAPATTTATMPQVL